MLGGSLAYTDVKVLGTDEGITLGLSYGKVIGTILVNVYVITFRIDVGTELGSLDVSFDGSNDNMIEELLLGYSQGSTGDKVLGYNEGIKLGLSDGKVFVTKIENEDVITLGIDVGTELGSFDESFDCSNDGNL